LLTIKNDGLPFLQPAGARNRMGLRIMNYRASTIGATLEIKPLHKSGTLVTCALPLNHDSPTPKRELTSEQRPEDLLRRNAVEPAAVRP
jgi:hypothetical protein